MQKILYNLALIDTLNFCKVHNIDPSGSYLYKATRGYTYTLYKTMQGQPNKALVSVTFHHSSAPTHIIYN